jgi:phage terminase large subunit GpA-like protein
MRFNLPGYLSPRRLIADRLAASIRPAERLAFDQWLPKNLILIDGPQAGEPWSVDGAPYLPGIAECLSDDHPCNLVTVRKCQQSGASILALGWCLYVAEREPANMLYGVPGIDALKALNNTKFQPLTDAFHKHVKRTVILPQMSRSGAGSTTYEKKFAGGFLALGNANSVMDLSMITVRKGVKDEVSKWQDIPGYGDPEKLFFGRFTAHRRVKDYKIFEISTPEIDSGIDDLDAAEAVGHCRIDRSFRKSDQRYWHCLCPECGAFFVHHRENLLIDAKAPHRTVYACECGHHVTESERVIAVRAGEWESILAEAQREGRHPGFHVDAFISLMMSYEAIAEDALSAKTETEKKALHNLTFALPYKFGGDAPDHVRLRERVEQDLIRGHVPPRGLIITAYADVQMRGIWLLIIAHAPNREKWVIEAKYLDGDTADHNGAVFDLLKKETIDREFPDSVGGLRRIDAIGVDSGYRSHIVYAWVRQNQRVHPISGHDVLLATKGLKGWGRPAIGQPKLMDINLGGKVVREGVKVWGLGTWPLKSEHYTNLHLARLPDALIYPDGYCHHGGWLDEVFFRQITAESLQDIRFRGRITGREWVKNGPNHYLDCYVGNHALGEYLGLSSTTKEQWAALAAVRGMPQTLVESDLFTVSADKTPPAPVAPPSAPIVARETPKNNGWLGHRKGWLNK